MGVLNKMERGMSIAVVRWRYGGTEQTICFIKKKRRQDQGKRYDLCSIQFKDLLWK